MAGVTVTDKVVAEGVHQVKDARGSVRIPPGGGKRVEVGDFGGVDG